MSDHLERKRVLMTGLVIACAGSVLAALAPDLTWLVVVRVTQGAGNAACMVIGRALVQDLFAAAQRTRVMAHVGMAMSRARRWPRSWVPSRTCTWAASRVLW